MLARWLREKAHEAGNRDMMLRAAHIAFEESLAREDFRVAEKLAAQHLARMGKAPAKSGSSSSTSSSDAELSPAVQRVQNLLTHRLATRVVINHGDKRGSITIEYYGSDDLNRILTELGIGSE